jgi:hypothetical protein
MVCKILQPRSKMSAWMDSNGYNFTIVLCLSNRKTEVVSKSCPSVHQGEIGRLTAHGHVIVACLFGLQLIFFLVATPAPNYKSF